MIHSADNGGTAGSLGTVSIESHGCKLNQADSEALARRFIQVGYTLAGPSEPADIYVINTCTVTHVADGKARHALRAARAKTPSSLVVATGCYAERVPQEVSGVKGVDMVVGNSGKGDLVEMVLAARGDQVVPCAVGDDLPGFPGARAAIRTRAMVKIQEGCNQVCAYCIVPKVRGRERSIPTGVLLDEVRQRVEEGYREVVLTGTQLGSYGFDLSDADLRGLLKLLLLETKVERLRVSSLQPQEINRELLELWQDPRLCPHFHMPLQSGNDSVLKRMRRRYTTAQYAGAVQRVRAMVPGVSITADVVVGFPGEGEGEFQGESEVCSGDGIRLYARVPLLGAAGDQRGPYGTTGGAPDQKGTHGRDAGTGAGAGLSLPEQGHWHHETGALGEGRPEGAEARVPGSDGQLHEGPDGAGYTVTEPYNAGPAGGRGR